MRRTVLTRLVTIQLAAILLAGVQTARAQDDTTEAGREATRLLPDASAIGEGWSRSDVMSPDLLARYSFEMSPDVFREGATAIYYGPNGARIVIVSLLTTESRVAIRKSWEDASELFSSFSYRADTDYTRDQELEMMDPPASCVEAKRTEGTETGYLMPFGGTMCAADPDVISLVFVSGEVDGRSGVEAADTITDSMFGESPGSEADDEGASETPGDVTSIDVDMVDLAFEPIEIKIQANTDVSVNLTNSGVLPHAMEVVNQDIASDEIPGGGSEAVIVNLPPGEYVFVCPIPGHADAGMVGTLIVE